MFRHHVIRREQRVQGDPDTVFGFFADAGNLESITPPWLSFHIVTPRPIAMRQGTLIEYELKLHGLPISWLTRIDEWVPGERFVDSQLQGPYALWHHTHTFEPIGDGVTRVTYVSKYESAEGLQKVLEMGVEEGSRQAINQIDALLAS